MPNDPSDDEVAVSAAQVRGFEALFASAFAKAMSQCGGFPPAACMKLAVDARTDTDLNDAIVHLHLLYFLQSLGRQVSETDETEQAIVN